MLATEMAGASQKGGIVPACGRIGWVAHASRVLAIADFSFAAMSLEGNETQGK
jgi:hypothetical protein